MPACNVCQKRDANWQDTLHIPRVAQFCGSLKSPVIISHQLLYFRIFSAIYAYLVLAHNFSRFVRLGSAQYWLIFLTQWTGIAVAAYFTTAAILHHKLLQYTQRNDLDIPSVFHTDKVAANQMIISMDTVFTVKPHISHLATLCSALNAFALAPSLCITVANWAFLTNYATYFEDGAEDIEKLVSDIHMHGVLLILMLIDFSHSMSSVTYNSAKYPFAMSVLYALWSLFHYLADVGNFTGDRYIYALLNWAYPATAMLFCALLVAGFASVHLLFAWIKYRFLLSKWTPPRNGKSSDEMDANADDSKQAPITKEQQRNVEIVPTHSISTQNEHKTQMQISLEVPPTEETLSEKVETDDEGSGSVTAKNQMYLGSEPRMNKLAVGSHSGQYSPEDEEEQPCEPAGIRKMSSQVFNV